MWNNHRINLQSNTQVIPKIAMKPRNMHSPRRFEGSQHGFGLVTLGGVLAQASWEENRSDDIMR